MNINETYNTIEVASDSDNKKRLITNYLTSCLPLLEVNNKYLNKVIYNIASLMSTEYIQSLDKNDEINKILTIAGEMEDPIDNNQDNLDILITLIKNLNKNQTTEEY